MSGKLPEISDAQRVKHTAMMFVAYVVISMPFLLLFGTPVFMGVQIFMFVGVNLIERQLKRMNTTSILCVQTVSQGLKFAILSVAWPISLGAIRDKADVFCKNEKSKCH